MKLSNNKHLPIALMFSIDALEIEFSNSNRMSSYLESLIVTIHHQSQYSENFELVKIPYKKNLSPILSVECLKRSLKILGKSFFQRKSFDW